MLARFSPMAILDAQRRAVGNRSDAAYGLGIERQAATALWGVSALPTESIRKPGRTRHNRPHLAPKADVAAP